MRPDLSIVVPAYNEAESLPELADQIRAALDGAGLSFEVWLVDDGSDDGSWATIQDLHSADRRFAGVRFRRNYGKSAALAAGFRRANGRCVATLERVEAEAARSLGEAHPVQVLQQGHALAVGDPAARLQLRHQGVPTRGDRERPCVR